MIALIMPIPVLAEVGQSAATTIEQIKQGDVDRIPLSTPIPVAQPKWNVPPQVLHLDDSTRPTFLDERRARMETLSEAMAAAKPGAPDSPEVVKALIELAEFYYARAMAPEGLSVLGRLDDARLPPGDLLRRAALELALGLMDPRDRPLTPRAERLLGPEYMHWPDQPLFLALRSIRDDELAAAAPHLRDIHARLPRFPKDVRAEVLPNLLFVAVESRQWRIARDFAGEFHDHPQLKESAPFYFLLGRAAEAGGDLLAAFDSYAMAMPDDGLWGHRTRRALVTMGLKNDLITVADARQLLEQETQTWRGDTHALNTLGDLAAVQQADGDSVAAVGTFAAILDRYPHLPEAELIRQKARSLIADIYDKGAKGEMPLTDFLNAHRRIAPDYRFEAGFAAKAELFANRFLEAGSTLVAAQEFQAVRDHLAVSRDLGLIDVDDRKLDILTLQQADSLMIGGQYDAAAGILADPLVSGDPLLLDKRAHLLTKLYSETGQSAALLQTAVQQQTVGYLKIKAAAFYEREDWANAQAAYRELWDRVGDDLDFADAIQFLLASYRNGDTELAMTLARTFPKLTDLPQWSEIAGGLIDQPAEIWPLRKDAAQNRVDQAQKTLENVKTVTNSTN